MANRRGKGKVEAPAQGRGWGEFTGVALLALGILTLGGLFSYQTGATAWMGPVGHLLAGALYASFGMAAYLVALGVIAMGVQSLLGRGIDLTLSDAVGFTIATIAGCAASRHGSEPRVRGRLPRRVAGWLKLKCRVRSEAGLRSGLAQRLSHRAGGEIGRRTRFRS